MPDPPPITGMCSTQGDTPSQASADWPEGRTAVIFDLDGTLVDSVPALFQVYLDFLRAFGRSGNWTEFATLIGPPLPEIVSILKQHHGLDPPAGDLLDTYSRAVAAAYRDTVAERQGASALLDRCAARGLRLALATSATRELAGPLLSRLGWESRFEVVVYGNDVKRGKPAPDLFELALGTLAVAPAAAVVIEDSPAGATAARSAGIDVIQVGKRADDLRLLAEQLRSDDACTSRSGRADR